MSSIRGRAESAYRRFLSPKPAQIGAAERENTEARREARFKAWAKGAKRTPEYRKALAEGRIRWNEEES